MGKTVTLTPRLAYYDMSTQSTRNVSAEPLVFTVASPAQVADQEVDDQVLTIAARLEAEKAKLKAMALERDGERDKAKALLRGTAQMMDSFALAPAAQAVRAELEELEEEVDQGISQSRRKAVTYSAYRAQRSRRDYKK
jgi:hypothetical protein